MPEEALRKRWLRSWTRFLTGGLLIVVLSGGATAVLAWHRINTISKELFPAKDRIHTAKGLITPSYSGAPQTFLLIGSDKRAGSKNIEERESPPRSDTMLLVRLDPRQGQTSVLSIPRDLLVKIVTPSGEELYPEKMNAAYSIGSEEHTKDGGAKLVAKTIENLLHIQLNGIIDVTFKGFIKVVDALGCVYINVDHRYWHTSEPTPEEDYSSIHLFPGYQKLCYEKALSYVRYRHTDSDFVRVARQQEFIRQLREQVSLGKLVDQIDHISKEVGKAVLTTFNSGAEELLKLTKLIAFSQRKPLRQVKFRYNSDTTFIEEQEYVTAGPREIKETVNDFLHGDERVKLPSTPKQSPQRKGGKRRHRAQPPAPASLDLYPTSSTFRDEVVKMSVNVPLPVIFPKLQTGPAIPLEHHRFKVKTRQGVLQHGFIEVFEQDSQGGYYDVEGMTWNNPPLINNPSQTENIGKRHYILIDDGAHIHVIAWHEGKDLYWVNNTLLEELTNAQMIYIAQSARPLR